MHQEVATHEPVQNRPLRRWAAHPSSTRSDSGQTTAEYALVLLAAGTIAMLVVSWARGDNSIAALFDLVLTKITNSIE